MVTFALQEDNEKRAVYHYYPEGKIDEGYGIITLYKDKEKIEITKLADEDSQHYVSPEEIENSRETVNKSRAEEGLPPLTEEEWPSAKGFTTTFYADHVVMKIVNSYNNEGILPTGGSAFWY